MAHKEKTESVRDPVHTAIPCNKHELRVLDSTAGRRLRHILQLALTCYVHQGATHKRREHSVGVKHLAGQAYRVLTAPENLTDEVRKACPDLCDEEGRRYWGQAVCMGAICHDFGHLPLSHAAEKGMLPDGKTHEDITLEIVRSDELGEIFATMEPRLDPEDVAKLAVGKDVYHEDKKTPLNDLETLLAEIIVGDALGADRMDYVLRDSLYCGVAYGMFDHRNLIDSLRILPAQSTAGGAAVPVIGIDIGGLRSSEALLTARYFMYSQVYFHPVRKIYDIHLVDFLKARPEFAGGFPKEVDEYLKINDNHIFAMIERAAADPGEPGHEDAARISRREHFKLVYEALPPELGSKRKPGEKVLEDLSRKFGEENFRRFHDNGPHKPANIPVRMRNGSVVSSTEASELMDKIPRVKVDFVYADRMVAEEAKAWLKRK